MGCELTSAVRDSNGAGEPLIFCAGSAPAGYSHLSYMPATQPHEDSGVHVVELFDTLGSWSFRNSQHLKPQLTPQLSLSTD